MRAAQPNSSVVSLLPAGGQLTLEIACNKEWTSFGGRPTNNVACPGNYGEFARAEDRLERRLIRFSLHRSVPCELTHCFVLRWKLISESRRLESLCSDLWTTTSSRGARSPSPTSKMWPT